VRLRTVIALLFIALIGAGGAIGYYAYEHGFTKKWRRLIMQEFEKRGINAELEKLTIDPFEGIVARKVRIFQDPEHTTLLATINNITLDIDFARLLRDEQFLNTVDFRDADISFPIDPEDPKSERLDISNLSARIELPEERININEATFDLNGLEINITGSLLQPIKKSETAAQKDEREVRNRERLEIIKSRRSLFQKIAREIEKFHFDPDVKPRLDIAIFGDLEDVKSIESRMQLRATNIGRKRYYCDEVDIRLDFKYPDVLLDKFYIKDKFGELYSHAEHRLGKDSVTFGVESSIDIHTLLSSLFETKALGEVIFYDRPTVHMNGEYFLTMPEGRTGLPLKATGGIDAGPFNSRGVPFQGFHADIAIEHDKKFVRNLLLEHKTGDLSGQFLLDGDSLRYDGQLELNPTIFLPFFAESKTKEFLQRFSFGNSPGISVQFEGGGPMSKPAQINTRGRVALGPFHYNRVPVESAVGQFEIKNRDQIFTNFRVDRPEGHVSGDSITIDYETKIVTIKNLRGQVYPAPAASYVAPLTAEVLSPYVFKSPPSLEVNGIIDPVQREKTDLTVKFSSDGEANYDVLGKTLPLMQPSGIVQVRDRRVNVDLATNILGGNGTFKGNFNIDPNNKTYSARFDVANSSFTQIAKLYEFDTDTQGELSGHFAWTGIGGSSDQPINGDGQATIINGNVFAIPILGPLTKFINTVSSKETAGYSVAHEATANFNMQKNVVFTRDFSALTPGLKLTGKGQVNTITKEINFDAEMNFRGTVRSILFFPISKLFKYKGEGTLSDPRWRPTNFSLPKRDDTPEAASDLKTEEKEKEKSTPMDIIKKPFEVVPKLFELPGKILPFPMLKKDEDKDDPLFPIFRQKKEPLPDNP
jgi:hypothetical protein